MGTWGTAIFSDDLAADVRDDWREAILDGLDREEATQKLLADYREILGNPGRGNGVLADSSLRTASDGPAPTGHSKTSTRDHRRRRGRRSLA